MLQIGAIEIAIVSDGIVHVDAGGPFGLIPRSMYRSILEPDANNLVPMVLHCLLIRAGGKTIVIDTGYGTKLTPKIQQIIGLTRPDGGLLDALARHGVQPDTVDMVIDTHLHADHCGGNTRLLPDESGVQANFPKAEYVTHRRGYEDPRHPNEHPRAPHLFPKYQPPPESGPIRLLKGGNEDSSRL